MNSSATRATASTAPAPTAKRRGLPEDRDDRGQPPAQHIDEQHQPGGERRVSSHA
jgi:hypothetical protein